jgi:hypothetical protein
MISSSPPPPPPPPVLHLPLPRPRRQPPIRNLYPVPNPNPNPSLPFTPSGPFLTLPQPPHHPTTISPALPYANNINNNNPHVKTAILCFYHHLRWRRTRPWARIYGWAEQIKNWWWIEWRSFLAVGAAGDRSVMFVRWWRMGGNVWDVGLRGGRRGMGGWGRRWGWCFDDFGWEMGDGGFSLGGEAR